MIDLKKNALSALTGFFRLFGKKVYIYPVDYNPYKKKESPVVKLPGYVSIIDEGYGHANSRNTGQSVDQEGRPLPWFTYPAIEYLKQLDLTDKIVFEWGSGNSSLFFSAIVKQIYSTEHHQEWYEKVKAFGIANQSLIYAVGEEYVNAIKACGLAFDIIIIDGILRNQCAEIAQFYLAEGGMIILDNSDRHPDIGQFFRRSNLMQVDMHGLGPINEYTWTTSFFFSRSFNFTPVNDLQPVVPIGGGY